MSIIEYVTYCYAFSRYFIARIYIEFERIRMFIKGLNSYYQLVLAHLVFFGGFSEYSGLF